MAARKSANVALADWRAHRIRPRRRRILFEILLHEHLERKSSEASIRDLRSAARHVLLPAFSGLRVDEIDGRDVEAWIVAQQETGYAGKTVLKHLSILSGVFETARELGACDQNPARQLRPGARPVNRVRDPGRAALEVLETDEVRQILELTPPSRRYFWGVQILTGARFGEAAELRWSDLVDREPLRELLIARAWDCRDQEVKATKSGKPRRVPIHPLLEGLLRECADWWRERFRRPPGPGDLVAPRADPRAGGPKHWHETTALRWWHKDLAAARIPHPSAGPRRLHSTRHTFISRLLAAGAAESVVKGLTHHEDRGARDAFQAYVHHEWRTYCAAVLLWEI